MLASQQTETARFHQHWNHLNDPHVRALAWLLDSPDLLDVDAPQWQGHIATLATLPRHDPALLNGWLACLEQEPARLHAAVNNQPGNRLGRYAEKLMAFYFRHLGILAGHGVQVQSAKNGTVGEFDFLLSDNNALRHWEFATKFYLLASDRFVGPNLADTLDAKMQKILGQQLALAQHPAAQIHLPQPVGTAQALIKGWLFYGEPDQYKQAVHASGLTADHCRGFWCSLNAWSKVTGQLYVILPRLRWLAPAKVPLDQALGREAMAEAMRQHFAQDGMPVLIAVLEKQGNDAIEINRGFIVADDWRDKAQQYVRRE